MFGKIKRWLNVEGVKISIECHDFLDLNSGTIEGQIRLVSMDDVEVEQLELRLIEIYRRGRGRSKRIDEYILGESLMKNRFVLKRQEDTTVEFKLLFKRTKSKVEHFGDKNIVTRTIATGAHWLKGVRSDFKLEVRAKVRDVAIHPYASKVLLPK